MMLANGGALYIDAGKPAPGLMDTSLENNRLIGGMFLMQKRGMRLNSEYATPPPHDDDTIAFEY